MTFRSKLELLAAIPHIKDAPKKEAIIENLCFRPERNERSFPEFMELTPDEELRETDGWKALG